MGLRRFGVACFTSLWGWLMGLSGKCRSVCSRWSFPLMLMFSMNEAEFSIEGRGKPYWHQRQRWVPTLIRLIIIIFSFWPRWIFNDSREMNWRLPRAMIEYFGPNQLNFWQNRGAWGTCCRFFWLSLGWTRGCTGCDWRYNRVWGHKTVRFCWRTHNLIWKHSIELRFKNLNSRI